MRDALERAEIAVEKLASTREDRWYPRFHIAGVAGWINDPNGLSFYNGRYHVYFQHHPFGSTWGPMHWGHVSSADLVTWEREPIALAPSIPGDADGVFSGSAAISDEGELVLYYTGHEFVDALDEVVGADDAEVVRRHRECQAIAVSRDANTFEKKGVIIDCPEGFADFRDPKVWKQGSTWYMVLGVRTLEEVGEVWLYTSPDMYAWTFDRVLYRSPMPGVFMLECPDFIPFGDRWVLLFSPMGLAADGYDYRNTNNVGYVVGTWEPGDDFAVTKDFVEFDKGANFYAPQTFVTPDGRRLLTAWMGGFDNLALASQADGWCGQLTALRELSLSDDDVLLMPPIAELDLLRTETLECGPLTLKRDDTVVLATDVVAADIELEIDLTDSTAERIGLAVHKTAGGNETLVVYDAQAGRVLVDRRNSGSGNRGYRSAAPASGEVLRLRVLVDAGSVEVFLNDGEDAISSLVFPGPGERSIELFSEAGSATITRATVHRMGAIFDAA